MGLIKCPDCEKMISDKAPACINCGRPIIPEQTQNKSSTIQDANLPHEDKIEITQDDYRTQQEQQRQQKDELYYYDYGWKGPYSLEMLRRLYSEGRIDLKTQVKSHNALGEVVLSEGVFSVQFKDVPLVVELEETKQKCKGVRPMWLRPAIGVSLGCVGPNVSPSILGAENVMFATGAFVLIGLLLGHIIARQINKLNQPISTKILLTCLIGFFCIIFFSILFPFHIHTVVHESNKYTSSRSGIESPSAKNNQDADKYHSRASMGRSIVEEAKQETGFEKGSSVEWSKKQNKDISNTFDPKIKIAQEMIDESRNKLKLKKDQLWLYDNLLSVGESMVWYGIGVLTFGIGPLIGMPLVAPAAYAERIDGLTRAKKLQEKQSEIKTSMPESLSEENKFIKSTTVPLDLKEKPENKTPVPKSDETAKLSTPTQPTSQSKSINSDTINSKTTNGIAPIITSIVTESSESFTEKDMDQKTLKRAESWIVQTYLAKARSYYAEMGFDPKTFVNPKVEVRSAYVNIGGKKLVVIRAVSDNTRRLVVIMGFVGTEHLRVNCIRNSNHDIPIFSGACGEKIKEAFGVSIDPNSSRMDFQDNPKTTNPSNTYSTKQYTPPNQRNDGIKKNKFGIAE